MKTLTALVFMALGALPAGAQDTPDMAASAVFETQDAKDLTQFVWIKRPIVVFADTPADPRFVEQVALLKERSAELEARDVVVLLDSDPASSSELRKKLRPRGFMVVLIGKDGGVKLRKPFPWDVREFSRAIDKMPLRREELRNSAAEG